MGRNTTGINQFINNASRDAYLMESVTLFRTEDSIVMNGEQWIRNGAIIEDAVNGVNIALPWISPFPANVTVVAANGSGTVVAATADPISSLIVSTDDGTTWNTKPITGAAASTYWSRVCWTGSKFIAVSSANTIATSSDGVSWAQNSATVSSYFVGGCIAANGATVVVASASLNPNNIACSTDSGASFTQLGTGVTVAWGDIVYGGGRFVLVGNNGTVLYTGVSTDGSNWTYTTEPLPATFTAANMAISYVNGKYVLTFISVISNVCYVSSDGISWAKRVFFPNCNISYQGGRCVFLNGVYYIPTNQTTIITSTDLVTFSSIPAVSALGSTRAVFVTNSGLIKWFSPTNNSAHSFIDPTKKYVGIPSGIRALISNIYTKITQA